MSPEKQRVAIATACGWTRGHTGETQWVSDPHGIRAGWASMRAIADVALPDYLNDLNACHEAEKVLSTAQKSCFVGWLNYIHPSADIHYSDIEKVIRREVFCLVHTTAAQRYEAFLRTLGLWEEEANEPRSEEADVATVIPDPLADMRARAEAGDRHAQCTLGDAYAHGMEVAQDRVESDRWYAMFSAPIPTEEAQ